MKGVACGKFRGCAQNWQKACDHENRILWQVFGQNKIFWTRQSWIISRVLVLVAGLFTFQVLDVSSDVNSRNIIRNKAEISTHKHNSNGVSMCSSIYCSTFAPLFFLYFWVVIVFWDSLTFSFYFFVIFSSLRITKKVTIENMSLNKWKAWPVENSKDVLKIDKKLVTTKIGSCGLFLSKINFFEPIKAE